jgi:hypothetical protein
MQAKDLRTVFNDFTITLLIFVVYPAGGPPEETEAGLVHTPESMSRDPLRLRLKSSEDLISTVHQYLDMKRDSFLRRVFDKFAEGSLMRTRGLQNALIELSVSVEAEEVEKLITAMDPDEKGGLDFEEFKRAVQPPQTQLEQWSSMLPLAGMLARSLPVSGGQGDQPLRDFSRLDEDDINTTVKVFSEGLRRLLMEAKEAARVMFSSVDKKALEASKDSAGGVSVVSKYKTFKMSTGKVKEYFEGISSRIGALY